MRITHMKIKIFFYFIQGGNIMHSATIEKKLLINFKKFLYKLYFKNVFKTDLITQQ